MKTDVKQERVLLLLLPFWAPLIPPMGISTLKGYLKPHGITVKTVDANMEPGFEETGKRYLAALEEIVPQNKRWRLQNAGMEVFRYHQQAHNNYDDEERYLDLIVTLVYKSFYTEIDRGGAVKLKEIVADFYEKLETYILELLEKERPTVLGISVYNDTMPASLFAFRQAKEKYPHIRTVMGGGIFAGDLSVGSPNYRRFLERTPYIDKIVVGEGERILLAYLRGELPADRRVYTQEDVGGGVMPVGEWGEPDYADLELKNYPIQASHGSRSCPFECSFCCETIFWGKYRKKNARRIYEELVALYRAYGNQLFLMCDSLLNPYIKDLAGEIVNSGESIYWDGYLRVDKEACKEENTIAWRRGGFFRARLGLESGSARMLEMMGKKITPGQIRDGLRSLANAGIKTTSYWVIGHPGETEEDFRQTLDIIEEMQDSIYEATANPFHYYLTGQVKSDQWAGTTKNIPLYPEEAMEMLIMQQWSIDGQPSREVIYERANRFVQHIGRLGIPAINTLRDIYTADRRWKKLHQNAAPSLVDFMEARRNPGAVIDENKTFKQKTRGRNIQSEDGDWGF